MMARHHQHLYRDRRTPADSRVAEIWISATRWCAASAVGWEFALTRVSAQSSEGERAGEGDEQATTERWRDKRPQCAARSVGCCCFPFLLIWQCAALVRNVRLTLNALQAFDISHIAEAGHD
ncbi:hypothetical protein IVB16_35080 [Bradyrhizobium sp. 183]|uniref:hypothetical protein n=1 Tax=unclassified Bradyrhizobium TaxID=2631580 RepID=UPI001FFEEF4A|nr:MULTISPECIES: hypothetical protein [unclassified Bradyrhizobium]UPJ79799.1 hypothetical protein IVB17_35075 [Bradyrhizobium sp. 184]UPJ87594.1 hypothetical protein IVB16_35080 [Bradyrhizobium sp. 183]